MKSLSDSEIIERAFGKIAILQETVETLRAQVEELREAREHDAQRIQFLTAKVERVGQLPELLTYKQAAAAFSISVRTLKEWRAAGDLPVIERGRIVRFRRADLESYLQGCESAKKSARRAA
jgi:excisionase family DNA binding protein